jgi:hypothetical protein
VPIWAVWKLHAPLPFGFSHRSDRPYGGLTSAKTTIVISGSKHIRTQAHH